MKKRGKATISSGPSGPTAAMTSVQPTTPLQSSASSRFIPDWQWDSLRPMLARPRTEVSASQVAEFIYMAIRVPGAPLPPSDFATNIIWDKTVKALNDKARRQDNTLAAYVDRVSRKFEAAASPPLAPSTGKRSTQERPDSSGGIAVNSESPDIRSLAGFRPSEVTDANDRAWLKMLGFKELANSHSPSDVRPAKRAHLTGYVGIDTIDGSTEFRNSLVQVVEALANVFGYKDKLQPLRSFKPLPSWKSTAPGRSTMMAKLPTMRHENHPNLLLYKLGSSSENDTSAANRMADILKTNRDIHIIGPAKSGKSRIMLEIACQDWALLFCCGYNGATSPWGSSDIADAVTVLYHRIHHIPGTDVRFKPDVELSSTPCPSRESTFQHWANNRRLVNHVFQVVLHARLIVLSYFQRTWKNSFAHVTEDDAKRQWVLLQIHPPLVDGQDVFHLMMRHMWWVDPDELTERIVGLLSRFSSENQVTRLMFDDVQALASKWNTAFGANAQGEKEVEGLQSAQGTVCDDDLESLSRAVLFPIVQSLVSVLPPKTRIVFAGTKFSESRVKQLDLARHHQKLQPIVPYTDLGGQYSEDVVQALLEKYLGRDFVRAVPPRLRRDIYYWLPGRHGFSVTFIEFVIRLGPDSVARVLSNVVGKYTGTYLYPGLDDIPEMKLAPLIPSSEAGRRRLREQTPFMGDALNIVTTWLFNGRIPGLNDDAHALVALGFGVLVADVGLNAEHDRTVNLTENLAAASLVKLFSDHHQDYSVPAFLNRGLGQFKIYASSTGFTFEDFLNYCIFITYSPPEGAPLSDMFEFCYLPPSWANETARLISVFKRDNEGSDEPIFAHRDLTARLAWATSKMDETLRWFKLGASYSTRVPFLKPDEFLGADGVFGLYLLSSKQEVLGEFQAKCWSRKHGVEDIEKALFKLSFEGHYYTNSDEQIYAKRTAAVQEAMIDLVGGSKLPMNEVPIEVEPTMYPYSDDEPKVPLVRIFAAFEDTVEWPDMTPGALGRYPVARLSKKFMQTASALFPSFAKAVAQVAPKRAS